MSFKNHNTRYNNIILLILTLLDTMVVPYPMFQSMNGKDTTDYTSRVEPSVTGGSKLAADIFKLL